MKIPNYNYKEVEESVEKYWKDNHIYEKAKKKNKGKQKYYFLDGPPYTSGAVHIGTAWNKALKDCVLRYKRMKGFDVWDRAGYDMHGLPTEHKVEQKFKIKNKDEIKKFGVEKFVKECRKFSEANLLAMNGDFKRLGVWMDFDNAYRSVDSSFMEGEWWLIKKAHENNRLYEGEMAMTWCAKCATSLAKHELEYKNAEDVSIFVKFRVAGKKDEFLIIWTTTPWTIPFNLGAMVHPELEYIRAKVGNETWIVAKDLANIMISNLDRKFETLETFPGEKLQGLKYIHPFEEELKEEYSKLREKSNKVHTVVLSSEYVNLSAGTGLVHMAPGCGPEDYEIGHREGIPPYNTLDEFGVFPKQMGEFAGLTAKKDDNLFIKKLEEKGALIGTSNVEHEYAHCWRCKSPVIYKTTKQWFFKVEDLKEKMRELNKSIAWVPDWAGSRQFDSWLDNLRDNGITRQRYWGTPVPIWKCENCRKYDVIGSIKELKEKAGKVPDDLHKPWIDNVTYKCECGGTKKRLPDILDVWIDAGTTSWTCLDYPQEEERFKELWPADFILEGKDQIRGWFNLLFVASMVSMNKPSFKSVYMHGFVQDSQGRKMSKSLGNYILPQEVIGKYGADTLRYYMIGGASPAVDINYNFEDMAIKHKNLMILWNIHKFLIETANNININPSKLKKPDFSKEERYIFSKLNTTIEKLSNRFENYLLNEAPWIVEELFLELSRTYMQMTREKSSTGYKEEKEATVYTIYHVLLETLKMFAPIAPYITEQIYINLKENFELEKQSIHHYDWPKADKKMIEPELEEMMDTAKTIIQTVLSSREKIGLGVRWPLKEIVVVPADDSVKKAVNELKAVIKNQVNAKEVSVKDAFKLKAVARLDYNKAAKQFGKDTPKIVAALSVESHEAIAAKIKKEGKFNVKVNGKSYEIKEEYVIIERKVEEPYMLVESKGCQIFVDKELGKEQEAEGFTRELMRRTQSLRKKAGLSKKDVIRLYVRADRTLVDMFLKYEKQIKEKVGASEVVIDVSHPQEKFQQESKEKVRTKEFEIFLSREQ